MGCWQQDPWLAVDGSFSLWAGSWAKAANVQRRGAAGRRRSRTSLLQRGSMQRLGSRSHGSDEPGEGLDLSGIWVSLLMALWGGLLWVAVVRRYRDAAWWWCGPGWRPGTGVAGGWLCGAVLRWSGDALRRRDGASRRCGDDGGRWQQACWRWKLGWASVLGPYCLDGLLFLVGFAFVGCFFSVVALSVITSNRIPVGGRGLSASHCTLCACFALGRWRVPYTCKWSLPLSSRGKLSVTGCSVQWHYDGKALRMVVMLCCSRVADQVTFPLYHRCVNAVKANRVASRAIFASWCFVEYKHLVVTQDSISGCPAYCNQGFRFNVPPLYSTISLIKAIKA